MFILFKCLSLHKILQAFSYFGIFLSTSEMNLTKPKTVVPHITCGMHISAVCVYVCLCLNMRLQKVFGVFYLAQNMFAICKEMLNGNAFSRAASKSQNQRNKYLPNNLAKTHTILCQLRSISLPLPIYPSLFLTRSHPSLSVCMSVSIHLCAEIRAIIFVTLT